MEDTLRYLDERYGGIKSYLRIIGISKTEVHCSPCLPDHV